MDKDQEKTAIEQAAPPRPLHYVLDKSEKFGSAWFHVMGPNGFITQTDSREWADKEAERLNFANGIEPAAPAAIEQARPQTPGTTPRINADWPAEDYRATEPAAAAKPAPERTPPQEIPVDSATPSALACGHSPFNCQSDCLTCLRVCIASLNKENYELRVASTRAVAVPETAAQPKVMRIMSNNQGIHIEHEEICAREKCEHVADYGAFAERGDSKCFRFGQ